MLHAGKINYFSSISGVWVCMRNVLFSIRFGYLSLVLSFFLATPFAMAQQPTTVVSCSEDATCGQNQYCWNQVCREVPVELRDNGLGALGGDNELDSYDPLFGLQTLECSQDSDCVMGDGRCVYGYCFVPKTCGTDFDCGFREICRLNRSDRSRGARARRQAAPVGSCLRVQCTQQSHCAEDSRCQAGVCRQRRR